MYTEIKLEKGLYNIAGKDFTSALEALDSDVQYKGTDLEGLDAFERQLKRFDIKVSGRNSDTVEKFFQSAESASLFPEFVARAIKQGISDANILPEIVAATTYISGYDYRSISTLPSKEDVSLKEVGQGAVIPATDIFLNQNLVSLSKRGRMLRVSYEAIRNQRLDLFAVTLRQIGMAIASEQITDAVTLIINGDKSVSGAEQITASNSSFSYSTLINFWSKFEELNLTTLLVSPATMAKILNFSEIRDKFNGEYMTSGKMVLPFGATLVKTTCVADNMVIGLDKSCALEMVVAKELTLESDKLIDRQLERTAITSVAGFSKIFSNASKVLKLV